MSEEIFGSLVGHIVATKNMNYGKVKEVMDYTTNNETFVIAVLDNGKAMRLSFLASLFASQGLFLRKRDGGYSVYAFTKDANVSKQKFGPQRKRIVTVAGTGSVNNTATIRGEKIDITKTVISNNPIRYPQI